MSSNSSAAGAVTDVLEKADVRELPFAMRFWDGSEIAAASGPARFTIVVNSPDAVAQLLREPNQLGLGRAWVSGELDVDEVFPLGRRFGAPAVAGRGSTAAGAGQARR